MSQDVVGSVSWSVFIGLTVVMFGWICYMTATALARTWRPWWSNLLYGAALGAADRLFEAMLFQGELLSLRGYLVATIYLVAVMLLSYRAALSYGMCTQYPWLYERSGLFGWRAKPGVSI